MERWGNRAPEIYEISKSYNTYVIGIPEDKRKRLGAKIILKKIMAGNIPNVVKDVNFTGLRSLENI